MITKSCHSLLSVGKDLILFNRGKELIKTASYLDPVVEKFAQKINSEAGYLWLLVHALGAGEYYDSNRNGDIFYEKALCHIPPNWSEDPEVDSVIAKDWQWGYPTFYSAYSFVQHTNKDPAKSVGRIEFVHWNDFMKRVELIVKLDISKALEFGGEWIVKRIDEEKMVDVSMGAKVPFDLETVSCDYEAYNKALATYNPKFHKSPAQAVLIQHKIHPIRGLSVTRNDYTELGKYSINKVFPDGRKVMLDNTFPRFFDISFVFIGAERPAKVMKKLASKCEIEGKKCAGKCMKGKCASFTPSGALMAELEKKAGSPVKKEATVSKKGTIAKEVGSTFNPKAMGAVSKHLEDLPSSVLNEMAKHSPEQALSTAGLSGIVMKPKEFQRIILINMNKGDMADDLDRKNTIFGPTDEVDSSLNVGHDDFHPGIFNILKDFLPMRSLFSPFLNVPQRVRMVIIIRKKSEPTQDMADPLLSKISAAYNGYRKSLYEHFSKEANLAIAQNAPLRQELFKYASGGNYIDETTLSLLRRF